MKLAQAIESYLALKRSLGAVFSAETRILKAFGRSFGDILLGQINKDETDGFCRGTGPPTRWWERKYYTLRDFFAFHVSRGHLQASPMPMCAPRIPRTFEPYIYSREELQRLLESTEILANKRFPFRHTVIRTLLLTLYSAGLRPSEGIRLRCCDVDLDDRILAIWDTKFFKSRLVPIGSELTVALRSHRSVRECWPMPAGTHSAFFASHTGKTISLAVLEKSFVRLREHAGIKSPPGSRWQPRLHDMRHSFAVHRLVSWYRNGNDVQASLALLSTYMGHANISGTQAYLTMTPELLAEASKRFESYAAVSNKENNHA